MSAVDVTVRVRKDTPECCRAALVNFAARDRYRGGGEPGDRIRCGCGNWLRYDHKGWAVAPSAGATDGAERETP